MATQETLGKFCIALRTGDEQAAEEYLKADRSIANANWVGWPKRAIGHPLLATIADTDTIKYTSKFDQDKRAKMADLLLRYGAKVDVPVGDNFNFPLTSAASDGDINLVNTLLRYGANANAGLDKGYTPLIAAAHCYYDETGNYIETVRSLLAHGAKVDTRGSGSRAPIILAAGSGKEAIVKLLRENGADINDIDFLGQTVLHVAASEGDYTRVKDGLNISPVASEEYVAVIKYLLDNGADINAKDKDGDTPLHVAAENKKKGMMEFLIKNGAIDTENLAGKTAADIIKEVEKADAKDKQPATSTESDDQKSGWSLPHRRIEAFTEAEARPLQWKHLVANTGRQQTLFEANRRSIDAQKRKAIDRLTTGPDTIKR